MMLGRGNIPTDLEDVEGGRFSMLCSSERAETTDSFLFRKWKELEEEVEKDSFGFEEIFFRGAAAAARSA